VLFLVGLFPEVMIQPSCLFVLQCLLWGGIRCFCELEERRSLSRLSLIFSDRREEENMRTIACEFRNAKNIWLLASHFLVLYSSFETWNSRAHEVAPRVF
jgi:hypothetical protein